MSQFHGCNIAMSWYLAMDGRYKYVVFGTGKEASIADRNPYGSPRQRKKCGVRYILHCVCLRAPGTGCT